MNNNNDLLRHLLDLYVTPAIPHSGPRLFVRGETSGYRILNAQRESLDSIVQEVGVYTGVHRDACLDVWIRRSDNERMFAPLVDCTMVRGTPPPFTPTGVVEAGAWVTYLFALAQRIPASEYDRVERVRYALSTMSLPRQTIEDGFYLPGSTCGIVESTRTQTEQFYSYGSVAIPLRGVMEQRTSLLTFDPSHRVRLEDLEAVAPHVAKRSQAESLTQGMAAQLAARR